MNLTEEALFLTNLEKYKKCFVEALELPGDEGVEVLEYQSIQTWDSVGHMGLMAQLEENFDIMLDTDDIIDFASFEKGKEILKKYDVEI
jgi:acyl carrier protein